MLDDASIQLLDRYKSGDERAATEIFERYVRRLIGLARKNMSSRLEQRVAAEDVVQSVYRSFFHRAEQGEYVLEESGDLWRLLAMITVNKVRKQARFHGRQKRNARLEQPLQATGGIQPNSPERFIEEPSVSEAVAAMDELTHLMSELDERQRTILEMRLQGMELPEIAQKVRRSERTVRRALDTAGRMLEDRLAGMDLAES